MSRAITVQVKFEIMFLQELQLFLASHPGFSNSTSAQASFYVGPISSCIIKLKFGNVGLSGGMANLRSTRGKTKNPLNPAVWHWAKIKPSYIGTRQALSALC